MPLEVKDIKYLDDKFDKVYEKIDSVKEDAVDNLKDHVDKEHRGAIGKTIIIVSSLIISVSCFLALLVIYLRGALQ